MASTPGFLEAINMTIFSLVLRKYPNRWLAVVGLFYGSRTICWIAISLNLVQSVQVDPE